MKGHFMKGHFGQNFFEQFVIPYVDC
jgi:hypothetical protein